MEGSEKFGVYSIDREWLVVPHCETLTAARNQATLYGGGYPCIVRGGVAVALFIDDEGEGDDEGDEGEGEDVADDDSRSFGPSGRPQGWED